MSTPNRLTPTTKPRSAINRVQPDRIALIVDDCEETWKTLDQILPSLGYRGKWARSWEEAMDAMMNENVQLAFFSGDLIEIDSLAIFRYFRLIHPELIGFLMTASPSEQTVQSAARMGFHRILIKPITDVDWFSLLEDVPLDSF